MSNDRIRLWLTGKVREAEGMPQVSYGFAVMATASQVEVFATEALKVRFCDRVARPEMKKNGTGGFEKLVRELQDGEPRLVEELLQVRTGPSTPKTAGEMAALAKTLPAEELALMIANLQKDLDNKE